MEMLSSKQKTAIIIAGVIVVGIFIFYMTTKSNNYITPEINEIAEDETKEEEISTSTGNNVGKTTVLKSMSLS